MMMALLTWSWFEIAMVLLAIGMAALLLDMALSYEVVLSADEVVVRSKLGVWNRRLARKEIAAKVVWSLLGRKNYILYPASRRLLGIALLGNEDDYFRKWMASIPQSDWRLFMRRLLG